MYDICNSSHGFGEKLSDIKVIEKLLRSLTQRFDSKVTAIEESKDLDSLRNGDLVGSLITYKSGRF